MANNEPGGAETADAAPPLRRKRGIGWWLVLSAMASAGLAAYAVIGRDGGGARIARWSREQAMAIAMSAPAAYAILDRGGSALVPPTREPRIGSVDVVTPKRLTEAQTLVLPADIEANFTAPIHARTNGYVKSWRFDIGARVKAGDLLAEIDTPELDQQFAQMQGELAKAQANLQLAKITSARWRTLRSSQAVSQQAVDEKSGGVEAREAEVAAAQANLDRIKALAAFNRIVAPFDGVVTARRIDVGALVSAANNNQPALFDVAAVDRMRVYVRVPQVSTASLKPGMAVSLRLPQYPGRVFPAKLETTANAISKTSRALLVELTIDNPDGVLSTGAYAEATFKLPLDRQRLVIPANAVIFRGREPQVALVEPDGAVHLKAIEILVDKGTTLEIAAGLALTDALIVGPPDSIADGDVVRIASKDGEPIAEAAVPVSGLRTRVGE